MGRKLAPIAVVLVILLAAVAAVPVWQARAYAGQIYPGVTVEGVDLGGLTVSEAAARLKGLPPVAKALSLHLEQRSWPMDLRALGLRSLPRRTATHAYSIGRSGRLMSDLSERWIAWTGGIPVELDHYLDSRGLEMQVRQLADEVNRPPVSARFLTTRDAVRIEPSQSGHELRIRETMAAVGVAIARRETRAALRVKVTEPSLTTPAARTMNVTRLMARFGTPLDPYQQDRNTNVRLSAMKLDGVMVKPGEVFSFNGAVGPRTAAGGYRLAPVIENGDLVMGIGGGICQVATTLFNAAMDAGLPIVERKLHSNYIAVYPLGRDATVAEGLLDLKFRNDTAGHILIRAAVTDVAVTFRLYGPETGRRNDFTRPQVDEIVPFPTREAADPKLPAGATLRIQRGVDGRTVRLKRFVRKDGELLFEEELVSRYRPRAEIIRVGTKPPAL